MAHRFRWSSVPSVGAALVAIFLSLPGGALKAVARSQTPAANGLRIIVIAGEDAVNVIQQKTAVAPIVEVRDRNDQPVAGVVVRFAVSGGRGATLNGQAALTVTTDALGRAIVSSFEPTVAGPLQIDVMARLGNQTATATIRQRTFASAADAAQATQAPSATAAATGGAAGGAGGGLSKLALLGIVGVGAAGAIAATQLSGGNAAPLVSAATATPSAVIAGTDTAVNFSVAVSDADNDPLSYRWEFGDGGTSTQAAPIYVYRVAGAFTARVRVNDDSGGSGTAAISVDVRTLTGTWRSTPVSSTAIGVLTFTLGITQSGTTLAVTTAPFANDIVSIGQCLFTGSVQGTSPKITLSSVPGTCTGILNGNTIAIGPNAFELDPGVDANTMSGNLLPNPRPVSFTRQ